MTLAEQIAAFNGIWDALAERGVCDARDSAEYRRCLTRWLFIDGNADRHFLLAYIRQEANRPVQ